MLIHNIYPVCFGLQYVTQAWPKYRHSILSGVRHFTPK